MRAGGNARIVAKKDEPPIHDEREPCRMSAHALEGDEEKGLTVYPYILEETGSTHDEKGKIYNRLRDVPGKTLVARSPCLHLIYRAGTCIYAQ